MSSRPAREPLSQRERREGLTTCKLVWGLYFWVLCLLPSSFAYPGSGLSSWWLVFLLFHSDLLLSFFLPLGSVCWVGPFWCQPFFYPGLSQLCCCAVCSYRLGWAPLAFVHAFCIGLVVLRVSLKHLAGHLKASCWRQSLRNMVASPPRPQEEKGATLGPRVSLLKREQSEAK